jgi:3-deoxy-D-manno-octulosonic-acid transferase
MGIPIAVVNGRISERSFRYYRLLPAIFRNTFSRISFAGMQSHRDADRAIALGAAADAVEVLGNMKFDAAPIAPATEERENLRAELGLTNDAALVVAGSTHDGEEQELLHAYKRLRSEFPKSRLLLAPRHPERFDDVEALIRNAGFQVMRRSASFPSKEYAADAVILLDTIGELARVYALASVSFVGGSLAKVGGHNIIEPASFGKPVIFGPHMHHFPDVKEAFLSENAAIMAGNGEKLYDALSGLLRDPAQASKVGEAARKVVETNRGATDRYFSAIMKYF